MEYGIHSHADIINADIILHISKHGVHGHAEIKSSASKGT
jgi:hypothetical protein